MALTLDQATEQRIQRELSTGRFAAPSDLLNHALDLLDSEFEEDWLIRNKEAIRAGLSESLAQAARGEGYSPDEARAILMDRRSARA